MHSAHWLKMVENLAISCIQVTTTSYGFSLGRQICLGFVQDFSGEGGQPVHIGGIMSLCFIFFLIYAA